MNLTLSEQQRGFVEAVRTFGARELAADALKRAHSEEARHHRKRFNPPPGGDRQQE